MFVQRAGQYILEWGQVLSEHVASWQRRNSAKREAENFHGSMPKRVKSEKGIAPDIDIPSDTMMKNSFVDGKLSKVIFILISTS